MQLNNTAYNYLKFVALVLLPGASAAYVGLGQIWGFPNVEQVVGTLTAIDTFLGLLLKASTSQYNKSENVIDGDLVVSKVDGEKYFGLGVNKDLEALTSKSVVRLSVVNNTPSSE